LAQQPFSFITATSVTSAASPDQVFDTIVDLTAHLEWSGNRASDETFKLLALEQVSVGIVGVGTEFTSTGANFNGTFHDRSVVSEMTRPRVVVIDTDARLDRKRGRPWEVHFSHRYDLEPEGSGTRITYTETISRVNYVPYWLRFWLRPLTRLAINSGDRKQLQNLADLAAERMDP
jgi:hypothetical protein